MAQTPEELQISRRSRVIGKLTQVTVPDVPRMPGTMINRFPELAQYQADMEQWRNSLQDQLNLAATRDRSEQTNPI